MTHHRLLVHPLVLRRVEVARVTDLTPTTRRITFTGDQLGTFEHDGLVLPPFATPGFDDHVKLIFSSDGDIESALPQQLEHGITWPPSSTRQGRDYTPRRFDVAAEELDLDFVLHGHGPAAEWATSAAPGDGLWFAGPKSSTLVPSDVDWVLLAGDETALPAIGRFFDERPVTAAVRAVIVVGHPSSRQDLAVRPGDEVSWVIAPPGDEKALSSAVRAFTPPEGTGYVWASAESRALLPLRTLVAREWDLPKSHVNITGYWHRERTRQSSGTVGAGPAVPQSGSGAELTSPVAWLAVRAALRLDLLGPLASGSQDLGSIASLTGIAPATLGVLLGVLEQAGVVMRVGRMITLSPYGEELQADEHAREEFDGLHFASVRALIDLDQAVTARVPAWQLAHGLTQRKSIDQDPAFYSELIEQAEDELPFVITGVPDAKIWGRGRRVAVTGPGALVLADALRRTVLATVTVVESTGPLCVLRDEAADPCPAFAEDWERTDVAATALALGHRTDAEAVALLTTMRTASGDAVLIERLQPDALNPFAPAEALLALAGTGAPPRTPEDIQRLATASGWSIVTHRPLGWGIDYFELAATMA